MAEYIDRGVIVHALMNIPNTPKQTFDVVCNAPAADVVPVVHGSWSLIVSDFDENALQCSVCGKELKIDDDADISEYRACPFCTAIMDGGASDERNSS